MNKITLGKTNLVIEKNGFGCLPIQRISEQDAVKLTFAGPMENPKKNAKRPACIRNTLVFAVGKGKPSYFTT